MGASSLEPLLRRAATRDDPALWHRQAGAWTPGGEAPGRDVRELAAALLHFGARPGTSALVLDRTHQLTGSYQLGVQDENGLRLAQADASGYCLELTWVDRTVWHLRGPGGLAEKGTC